MKQRTVRKLRFGVVFAACTATVFAAQRWGSKPYTEWSSEDVERLLTDSPWAKQASASFGAPEREEMGVTPPAGASGPPGSQAPVTRSSSRGVSDGKWDGGVSRNVDGELPTLPVTVRWESALPVRQALLRSRDAGGNAPVAESDKNYIVTVIGLVSRGAGANAESDLQQLQDQLMRTSGILRKAKPPITPEAVKIDSSTGAIHILFPRTNPIALNDKEVTFATQFGSMKVRQRFRLKDMVYRGKLEL